VHFAFTSRDDPASALTTLVILVAGTFVSRSWCRYLCPWGQFVGFLHRFSRLRILLNPVKCNQCGVCDSHCDVAAIEKGVIRTAHCQFCHACVDHCSNSALTIVDVWAIRSAEKREPRPSPSSEGPTA
jgi:polyferredoxin